MKLIIMADTVSLFLSKGIGHELKAMESGASSVSPKETYVVIEYPDNPITEPKWT